MHFPSLFRAALVALVFIAGGTRSVHAQTVLADIAGNYATSGPLTDSYSTGTWNYYASTAATGGTLTALTYGPVGSLDTAGYGLSGGLLSMPAVANAQFFGDGAAPAAHQLSWHPGNSEPAFTVIRWTAGAGEAGAIRLLGEFSRMGEPNGNVDFFIFVNGTPSYAQSSIGMNQAFTFDFTSTIATGQYVDFVLSNGTGGFGGDESLISGTISSAIPEPSTYAMLAGVLALGVVMIRRRTKK